MPTFQHSELLPEHEILQFKIPTATEQANQCSDPEENEAEHGTELYQINDWKYCYKLLILRSARVLARDRLLLGLFHGVPTTKKSIFDLPMGPDHIVLYQNNIEAVCSSEAEVRDQIRLTVIHELGHYFGMDENQLKDV